MNTPFWGTIGAVLLLLYVIFFPYFFAFRLLMWSGHIFKGIVTLMGHLIRFTAWFSRNAWLFSTWCYAKAKKIQEERELKKVRKKFEKQPEQEVPQSDREMFGDSLEF
mgnify:CR=1 FL=1|jgi:fucose 4-O-acetylase-like acetyltransferase